MSNKYPLEWLDSLILYSLNPQRVDITALTDNELNDISENVIKESHRIQVRIKNEIFSLRKKRQIRLQVRKYHSTLIFLLDTIVENQISKEFQEEKLSKIVPLVIQCLDELLSFLENRYSSYLSLDDRVPVTYLLVCKKELQLKLNWLEALELHDEEDLSTIRIIIDVFSKSIEFNSRSKITFRQILYERKLLKSLEEADYLEEIPGAFSLLDVVLIGLNFNSRDYINSFTKRLSDGLNTITLDSNKLSALLLYYKDFSQLYSDEKITYDAGLQNVKQVLDNWFKHEIVYLEKQIGLCTTVNGIKKIASKSPMPDSKLECVLSTDQLALILRAGDESRILKAKSMSMVFKTIVPYLSTPQKKELSYDSVRSKSYSPEERDKDLAILALEKIIKKIKSY